MSFAEGMESSSRMTPRMRKKKFQSFNWKNIEDNGDGTFTAYDGRAKKRLLKEYHLQGIRVRSRDQGNGTWVVIPVGVRSPRHSRISPEGRPRYNGRSGYYYPRRRQAIQPYLGPRPALSPNVGPGVQRQGPMRRSPSFKERIDRYSSDRIKKRMEQERGPYIVDPTGKTKLREGYFERTDRYGNKIPMRTEPQGFMGRLRESQEEKAARHEFRVAQSKKLEAEMLAKSTGPSTRIPGNEILSRQRPARPIQNIPPSARMSQPQIPHGVRTTTQIPAPSTVTRTSAPPLASDAAEIREARKINLSGEL